jgi:hypothetical protein
LQIRFWVLIHLYPFISFVFLKTLTPELNPSAQRYLPRFLLVILIFKGLTARRFNKSFGVKGLIVLKNPCKEA